MKFLSYKLVVTKVHRHTYDSKVKQTFCLRLGLTNDNNITCNFSGPENFQFDWIHDKNYEKTKAHSQILKMCCAFCLLKRKIGS